MVTGVMAAGKSSVAQALAERLPRSVHVRGDVFRRMIVSGRVDPTPDFPDEAKRQLELRYQLATETARAYAEAGFDVVLQDVILGPYLQWVADRLPSGNRYVVVLDPEADAVAGRETARPKTGYGDGWHPTDMVADHRATTSRIGLWLDTSGLTLAETVEAILDRLDAAKLD